MHSHKQREAARGDRQDTARRDDLAEAEAVLSSPGEPLETGVRDSMESHFGHDFSQIRIHSDARAEESAASLGARAYTAGRDIAFRSSRYDMRSGPGRSLLAHELTHVIQNERAGGPPDFSRVVPADDPAEVEARSASQLDGGVPSVQHSAPGGVALDGENGPMVMPADEIKGKNPNIARPAGGTIKGGEKPDDETQKVMAAIASARTRALGHLNGTKIEVMAAIDAFKGHAQSQIDAIDGEPSDVQSIIPALVGAVGGAISLAFPPAAGIVIGVTLVANLTNTASQIVVKGEGAKFKQGLKDAMQAFATAASNAHSFALTSAGDQISTALTNLAVSDTNVWNQLAIGGDRQLDWVISQIGIADPAKDSPFGKVLRSLMVPFASWVEKEKFQMGMTTHDKMVSESLPGEQSFKDMHKKMTAGENDAADLAKKMTDARQKKPE